MGVGVWPSQLSSKRWRLWGSGAAQRVPEPSPRAGPERDQLHSLSSLAGAGAPLFLCSVQAGKSFWFWEGGERRGRKQSVLALHENRDENLRLLQLPKGSEWRKMSASRRRGQTNNGVFIWVLFSVSGRGVHLWDDATNWCTVSLNCIKRSVHPNYK